MNETTPPWTEARMARSAWQQVREDLVEPARDFRPMPPLSAARFAGRPSMERLGARWLPHALVVAVALMIWTGEWSERSDPWSGVGVVPGLFLAVIQSAPLVMVLLRPIAAYWLSLGASLIALLPGGGPGVGLLAHLGVLVLVTLRTRPRIGAEMWLVSLVVMGLTSVFFTDGDVVLPLAFFSGVVVAPTAALRGWWMARDQVDEQKTLVADVRDQHSLLEERARIARELHDVVAHHMSVIAIQAEAAPYRVSDPPEELTRSFATIRGSAVAALAELRRVLGVLRFEGADSDLPGAPQPDLARLDELVDGVRAVGLGVVVTRSGAQRPLPQGVELSAFRIVQEALSNALRHAPGSEVQVELAYVLTGLGLRIVNTRPTGKAAVSPGMGHGVMGMRERASMLGGELTAGPTGDGGYEVAAFLPVGAGAGSGTEQSSSTPSADGESETS